MAKIELLLVNNHTQALGHSLDELLDQLQLANLGNRGYGQNFRRDVEHGAAAEARLAGEDGRHRLHQQDRPTHPGAEASSSRRLLQAPARRRRNQRADQVRPQPD